MDEKGFKKIVSAELRKQEFFSFCTNEPYRAGVPDVYACKNGLSIWLELKYTSNESKALPHPLSAPQSVFLRDINRAGGLGLVVVGLPNRQVHICRIEEAGKRTKFDLKDQQSLEEAIVWISNFAKGSVTPSTA